MADPSTDSRRAPRVRRLLFLLVLSGFGLGAGAWWAVGGPAVESPPVDLDPDFARLTPAPLEPNMEPAEPAEPAEFAASEEREALIYRLQGDPQLHKLMLKTLGTRGETASGTSGHSLGRAGHGLGGGGYSTHPRPVADRGEGVVIAARDARSTFAIDVDTGGYTLVRRSLRQGRLPAPAGVRVEELVNYGSYDYPAPSWAAEAPFAIYLEGAPAPFQPGHHLLRIGVKGKQPARTTPVDVVFLVDVSGSMNSQDRLGLVKTSLETLLDHLDAEDTVAIVTYASGSETLLARTRVRNRRRILAVIDGLRAGGSTAMGSGLAQAYAQASKAPASHERRVIVLSDGDANVGATSHEQLLAEIADYAGRGITLSTVGFGGGRYNDTLMEQLADKGDGNYSTIDSPEAADRTFGTRVAGLLHTIARDVKIQVDFDPDSVLSYRLLGYQNRAVADQDFRDDAVDGGEIGAGHEVTAIYDVILRDEPSGTLATVQIRAKPPGVEAAAREWSTPFGLERLRSELPETTKATRRAIGTALFAEKLRNAPELEEVDYAQIAALIRSGQRATEGDDRELLELVATARRLSGELGVMAAAVR